MTKRDLLSARDPWPSFGGGAARAIRWIRIATLGALALAGAGGCETIADIRDPVLDTSSTSDSGTGCADGGIVLEPPFDAAYRCTLLGEVLNPDLGSVFTGGLAFDPGDADTLYIVGHFLYEPVHLRSVKLRRDADGHVVGIVERNDYFDGLEGAEGLTFAPGDGTMLYTLPDPPEIVQRATLGGKNETHIALTERGYEGVANNVAFIPGGVPGAGRLAITSRISDSQGYVYTAPFSGGAAGAHDLGALSRSDDLVLDPGGIAYVAANPAIDAPSLLVADIQGSSIDLHTVLPDGLPAADSVKFASFHQDGPRLGPWGMTVDRASGDVLFVVYGRVVLYAIRGFLPPLPAP